ncbi:TIGR03000 domain-containing protein [Zavarzinella formosa]|uniref:TIGR03000 domain-containing protein n=1 Tax=Zavarzinella formosa TaxID=360055 RepID=UPI00030D3E6C|nr:TIGR03000 domain-containing protein [Zavarzinella formosa]
MSTILAFVALASFPNMPYWGDFLHLGTGHGSASRSSGCGNWYGASQCNPFPGPWAPNGPRPPFVPLPPCGYVVVEAVPARALPDFQAQIRVSLPADATLTVNGQTVAGSGASRLLTTPVLAAGREHPYSLRVEYKENGTNRVIDREVSVRGGTVSHVDFVELPTVRTVSAK